MRRRVQHCATLRHQPHVVHQRQGNGSSARRRPPDLLRPVEREIDAAADRLCFAQREIALAHHGNLAERMKRIDVRTPFRFHVAITIENIIYDSLVLYSGVIKWF